MPAITVFLGDDFSERDEWVFEAKERFGMPPLLKPTSTFIIVSCTLNRTWRGPTPHTDTSVRLAF